MKIICAIRSFVLVLPFLAVSIAWGAPTKTSSPAPKSNVAKPFPKDGNANYLLAKELLAHAFDAYNAAKSFQGAFILTTSKPTDKSKPEKEERTEFRVRTIWHVNGQGDKDRENTLLIIKGQEQGTSFIQTLRQVDNGRLATAYVHEKKQWSQTSRDPVLVFRSTLRPVVDQVSNLLLHNLGSSPRVQQGVEGGVPVYIVRDESQGPGSTLQLVFDVSNRALRSLTANNPSGNVELFIFDRKFNALLPNSTFEWKAPRGARQVPMGTLKVTVGVSEKTEAN